MTTTTPAGRAVPADPPLPGRAGWAAAGAVAAFVAVGLAVRLSTGGAPLPAAGAAAVALAAAALLARGRAVLPLALTAGAGLVVLGTGQPSNVGWFGVCLLAGWCALVAPRVHALLFLALALLVFAAEQLLAVSDAGWASWSIGTTFMTFAVLVLRRQRLLVAELHAAQAGLAERARVEERTRIARELHDVIAHSLTVTLLHIAGARMAVRFDPADADRALAEAERLGRDSLDEVRATVGLLKAPAGGEAGDAAPLPGLAAVPDLVERFRAAGVRVDLDLTGEPTSVPATTGLAVYRIVQEALTNAAKHAPGAPVTVRITLGERAEVVVDSAGRPALGGHGLGVDGMRERAASLGGSLTAGPGGPGWRVAADLPLPARSARSPR